MIVATLVAAESLASFEQLCFFGLAVVFIYKLGVLFEADVAKHISLLIRSVFERRLLLGKRERHLPCKIDGSGRHTVCTGRARFVWSSLHSLYLRRSGLLLRAPGFDHYLKWSPALKVADGALLFYDLEPFGCGA